MKNKDKIKVHVITHTHWDREWYLSFELFRARLLTLLDNLKEEMEKHKAFKFFTLDGQTVVLEDYFELRPEKKEEILSLIREKRVEVGPWYILPDEFLITGESFIRNYLIAQKILQEFEIEGMDIGYLPDMFGHNAYTPSILKGLELKAAVLWRGVGDASRKTEFLWRAPNGDGIITVNLLHSYSNGAHFGKDIKEVREVFRKEVDTLSKVSTTDNILIMNGTDHEFPLYELTKYFSKWSEEFGDVDIIHSTLSHYVDSVIEEKPSLREVHGELKSPKYEPILKDVTSTRIYIKLLNFKVQKLYTRYVEPLAAFLKLNDEEIDIERIDYGWKLILKSHPHDSICGCSVDNVHRDVEVRLRRALDVGTSLVVEFLNKVSKYIEIDDKKGIPILVFNPYEYERNAYVSAFLPIKMGTSYEIVDKDGKTYPVYIDEESEINQYQSYLEQDTMAILTPISLFKETISPFALFFTNFKKVLFYAPSLPGIGFKVFYLREANKDIEGSISSPEFENAFYKFSLNENGSFNLIDKIHNISYSNLNYLEDIGDRGDEYNFSPIPDDTPINTLEKKAEILEVRDYDFLKTIKVKIRMSVPSSIGKDNNKRADSLIDLDIEILYKFYKELPRIDVMLNLKNTARDHKLSFVAEVPEKIDTVLNDGYFGIVSHPADFRYYGDDYTEENISRYAMESFAYVNGERSKLAISTQGIHEYESHIIDGKTRLAFTLLRSVGWLSRDDLLTRKGNAGPPMPTPDAQCIGTYQYTYSFILLKDGKKEEVYEKTRDFLYEPVAIMPFPERERVSYMISEFDFERGIFLSALKVSQDGEGVVLRAHNQSEIEKKVQISFPLETKVYESNMREVPFVEKRKGRDVILDIKPAKIDTFLFHI